MHVRETAVQRGVAQRLRWPGRMYAQGRPTKPSLAPERALVHPMWWLALGVMALNDHVLKTAGLLPGVLTGKLSDFAGLLVAPALMAALVRARTPRAVLACHAAVGAVFAGIQLSAGFAGVWSALMGLVGFPWAIVCDPTDLLALPMLWVSWRVLLPAMHADASFARRGAERLLAAVGLLFCIATSDEDPKPEPEPEPEPPSCPDQDQDGWCADEDCDDLDPAAGPCPCIDGDGDGVCASFDCNDADAGVWDDCGFGGSCEEAPLLEDGVGLLATTVDSVDTVAGSCGALGGERVFAFDVPGESLQVVRATVTSLRPHALELRENCDLAAAALSCAEADSAPAVDVLALPGTRLYLVVEAATPEDHTDFEIRASSLPLVCGDGIVAGPEECDDGNLLPGDGCDAECRLEP